MFRPRDAEFVDEQLQRSVLEHVGNAMSAATDWLFFPGFVFDDQKFRCTPPVMFSGCRHRELQKASALCSKVLAPRPATSITFALNALLMVSAPPSHHRSGHRAR
jgi:hypothetical protein